MNPVRQAIWDVLSADSTLGAMATGGIHWGSAPEGTVPPLVIFHKQSGVRVHSFGSGSGMRDEMYLVKGVGDGDQAEDIDLRCQALLTNAALNVAGRSLLLKPMPLSDAGYGEDVQGEHYEHVGTVYGITTE